MKRLAGRSSACAKVGKFDGKAWLEDEDVDPGFDGIGGLNGGFEVEVDGFTNQGGLLFRGGSSVFIGRNEPSNFWDDVNNP